MLTPFLFLAFLPLPLWLISLSTYGEPPGEGEIDA